MSKRGLIQLKHNTPTQRQQLSDSFGSTRLGDASFILAPNELQRLLQQQELHNNSSARYGNSFNTSLAAGGAGPLGDAMSERSALETTGGLLYKEKTDMLFPQFLEVLQGRTNESEVFDTIQDLIQTCSGVLDELQREMERAEESALRQHLSSASWLEQELKTWKLVYALYKDRLMLQGDNGGMDCDVLPLGGSEKEVISQLYASNATLREYQLVVDWLESCYDNRDDGPLIANASDRTIGWENTLFQLLNKRELAFGKGVEIVQSLDPDAPTRERRPLHALDEQDNARLSRCIFVEVRQGRIDEAMALCKFCGQTWRAALLEGWRLHEDPNYEAPSPSSHAKQPIEGNPRRDVWKKCAWLMADSAPQHDEYTRAIAGVFCGHLESLKALLCNSWEDLLWAYLKVQIDIRVECEIRACCLKSYLPMPEAYWNGKMALEQIFDELAVHKDAAVRDQAASKVGIIQKYLILDNCAELLQHMRRWSDETETLPAHMLRFLTHIVLFMRQIGRVDKEDSADRIIAAYVECLIVLGEAQLVAFYTAALPCKQQIVIYSKFLERITETPARAQALEAAISAGLDVENITRHTVESLRQRLPGANDADAVTPSGGEISAFDQRKIRALEWLTFVPVQRGELLWQVNAMVRTFLGEGKTECVRAAYAMVPADSLTQVISLYGSKDNLPCREECSVKEFLGYKVYLVALDSFNEWSRLHHNPPKEPQLVGPDANFTERIASEHKEQLYRGEVQRWTTSLAEQARAATNSLFNVLLFPDKGWLIDPDTAKEPVEINDVDWENRQIQLDKLRSICIPEVVLLLHKVLHTSGDYKACIKLADEIASEQRQLYKVYTKHKLAELLSKLAESSLELLEQKLDPWGYPSTV